MNLSAEESARQKETDLDSSFVSHHKKQKT